MIHEILGINYYVIGPSLCLLMTGVFLLISDLTFKLKPRYQSVVVIVGLLDLLGIGRGALADATWMALQNEVYVFIALVFFIFTF